MVVFGQFRKRLSLLLCAPPWEMLRRCSRCRSQSETSSAACMPPAYVMSVTTKQKTLQITAYKMPYPADLLMKWHYLDI
eukprot:2947080-Amphidinium_carterae.1